ncbi:MAG: flagellar basal body protein FliL [Treponema sp.]|nr:flagellar basal body protein FliL [Treponema sp.]
MKRVEGYLPQTAVKVYRTLLIIAALLAVILITGTIYGFVKRGKSAVPPAPYGTTSGAEGQSIFSGLGKLRIPTADPDPDTLIISIAFPYNKNDRPFSEELASRISWFKTVINDYFGTLTAEEFDALDIDITKTELLKRFNSELRLGQIRELYIDNFIRL